MSCPLCNETLYRRTVQYASPLLAPATHVETLRDELLDLTGEVYAPVQKNYCASCGAEIGEKSDADKPQRPPPVRRRREL